MKSIKTDLIQLLNQSTDWISGEFISQQFGISRAAIAKHINALRKEGYLIEAATRRGYLLKQAPDKIELETIQSGLNTQVIGQGQWILLDESKSTNQDAIEHAMAGAEEGSIIIAAKQTSGRSTKGKKWFSPPRSIYFSVVLRPTFSPEKLAQIIQMGAQSLKETLKALANLDAQFQAPNGIYIDDKKIGGVLIESMLIASDIDWVVLGIGCNLNVELTEFPLKMQSQVTSTLNESQQLIGRNLFYQTIVQRLDANYQQILD